MTAGLFAIAPTASGALTLENAPVATGPGCRQVVIGQTTDAARVRPLVPRQFIFSRDAAGKAQLGYRVQTCDTLSIDGGPARRVTWSELGVRILPPEGLPEVHVDPHVDGHDYYVLAFKTADRVLARRMQTIGIRPAGAQQVRARRVWMDMVRVSTPLGDPSDSTAADVVAGGTLAAGEHSRRGTVTLSADLLGGMVARTTPVVHVHHWFMDGQCRLVRGEETKSRTVGGLAAFRLHADSGTLLAALAAPAGSPLDSQGTDPVVIGDTEVTWRRAESSPQALAPAAYEVLQQPSQGTHGGC